MWWSQTSAPNFSRRNFSAIAIPTRVAEALAERAGRRLDARRVEVLRVARRVRAELAELLDLVEAEVVAGEVQARVEQHRGVAGREHEAVAVRPLRVVPGCASSPACRARTRRARAPAARPGARTARPGRRRPSASGRVDAQLVDRLLRHRRGSRHRCGRVALRHLVERERPRSRRRGRPRRTGVSRSCDDLLHRLARRLEERARVELGGVRVQRLRAARR